MLLKPPFQVGRCCRAAILISVGQSCRSALFAEGASVASIRPLSRSWLLDSSFYEHLPSSLPSSLLWHHHLLQRPSLPARQNLRTKYSRLPLQHHRLRLALGKLPKQLRRLHRLRRWHDRAIRTLGRRHFLLAVSITMLRRRWLRRTSLPALRPVELVCGQPRTRAILLSTPNGHRRHHRQWRYRL